VAKEKESRLDELARVARRVAKKYVAEQLKIAEFADSVVRKAFKNAGGRCECVGRSSADGP